MSYEVCMGTVGEPVTLGAQNLSTTEQCAVASGAHVIYRRSPSGTQWFGIDEAAREECERRFPGFASMKSTRAEIDPHA